MNYSLIDKEDKIEGYVSLKRMKAEHFENLSDEKEAVIGEDFCVLLSHNG